MQTNLSILYAGGLLFTIFASLNFYKHFVPANVRLL